ncbi:D-lyxose/D-mannose family sugar isomerase [Sporolactobacillus terrae]|nr:D-lyxose/D-mannose family sugar isomerase [Sporolactobacillus terrae]
MYADAHIALSSDEIENMEFADFGLGRIEKEGLILVVYENNDRYCSKEMVLLPGMTCPEHRHPDHDGQIGKQETFRCRQGQVYLYVEGKPTDNIQASIPEGSKDYYTIRHEIVLYPGEQYTIKPNTLHWFQAGAEGAIVSEFSSPSDDSTDIFTDPNIVR